MRAAGDVFEEFGGHHASGGFEVKEDKVHELAARLSQAYEALASKEVPDEETMLDREMTIREIPHAMRDLSKLSPFGEGNRKPLFIFPRAFLPWIISSGAGGLGDK